LLPEKDVSETPNEFRPISLIHYFAKLISKVLALSKLFYDTFIGPAIGAVHCGSLFEKGFGLLVVSSGWTW
jgi:hypothetical protein